jgi:hypothetical protein
MGRTAFGIIFRNQPLVNEPLQSYKSRLKAGLFFYFSHNCLDKRLSKIPLAPDQSPHTQVGVTVTTDQQKTAILILNGLILADDGGYNWQGIFLSMPSFLYGNFC